MKKRRSIPAVIATATVLAFGLAGASAGAAAPRSAAQGARTIAHNTELGRAFEKNLQNQTDPHALEELARKIVSAHYIQHNAVVPPGRAGLVAFDEYLHEVIPNVHYTLRDVFATDSRVVARFTITGTLTAGPLLGVPARRQKLDFDGIDIWTVRDGQLYEHWDQFDWPRALIQLGIKGLPKPFVQAAAKPVNR